MGEYTLDTFRELCRGYLENKTGLSDTFLNQQVNAAYRHLAHPTIFDHAGLDDLQSITLVAATSDYALDADLLAVQGVFVVLASGKEQRVRRASFMRLLEDRSVDTASSGGLPGKWARRGTRGSTIGGRIYVDVFPSTEFVGRTLRVYYKARPATMTADGEFTVLDEIWDVPLSLLSAAFGWARLGQPERSDYYRTMAGGLINEYGESFDMDAIDPTDGFVIEPSSLRYSEISS